MRRVLIGLIALTAMWSMRAQDTAIYQQGGAVFEGISSSIKSALAAEGQPAAVGPVMVATNQAQAVDDLKGLEGKGVKYFFAVGTSASTLASQRPASSGIFIFVPNPAPSGLSARPKWAGVSPYPDPRMVLSYVRSTMNVQRVGILYTRKNNQEVAKVFEDAASAEKMPFKMIGLDGPEQLDASLAPALKDVDGVLLLIDPLAFSPDSLRFIVSTCTQAKKPVIGFLDAVASAGAPFAIYPPLDELGRASVAAMKALKQKGDERKIYYPSRFVMSVNEGSAKSLGIPYDASKVANKY